MSTQIPARGCRASEGYAWFKNLSGVKLWRLGAFKRWCWNRGRKRVRVNRESITDKPKIRQGASIAGWRYEGLEKELNYYYRSSGVSKGGHLTYMRGKFCFTPPRVECFNERCPWVELRVTWRGTAKSDQGVG